MKLQINKTGVNKPRKKKDHFTKQTAVLIYCENCGTELYGHWWEQRKSGYSSADNKEFAKIRKMTQCPVCKAKLINEDGFTMSFDNRFNDIPIDIDAEFEKMKQIRTINEKDTATNMVELLSNELDITDQSQFNPQKCHQLDNEKEELLLYLSEIMKTESNIILQSKYLAMLYLKRKQNERDLICAQKLPQFIHDQRIADTNELIKHLEKEIEEVNSLPIPKYKEKMPKKPKEPEYKTPHFFNRSKILQENKILETSYLNELAKYNKKLAEFENNKAKFIENEKETQKNAALAIQAKIVQAQEDLKQLSAEKAEVSKKAKSLPSPVKAEKELLKKEINEAEKSLKMLLTCLHELYETNIIFPKYQNIVAVSTFYEYLRSGRCNNLKGAHGAYNLYEAECRSNLIISQLNQVIESLDQIKNNQTAIYKELQTINKSLESLESSMNSAVQAIHNIEANTNDVKVYLSTVAKNSDIIAHNTEVSAHYTRINAELTNTLCYLAALK